MSNMKFLTTVILGVFAAVSAFGQIEQRQPRGVGGDVSRTIPLDYRNNPKRITDEGGVGGDYSDNATNTYFKLVPRGLGTYAKITFVPENPDGSSINLGADDFLQINYSGPGEGPADATYGPTCQDAGNNNCTVAFTGSFGNNNARYGSGTGATVNGQVEIWGYVMRNGFRRADDEQIGGTVADTVYKGDRGFTITWDEDNNNNNNTPADGWVAITELYSVKYRDKPGVDNTPIYDTIRIPDNYVYGGLARAFTPSNDARIVKENFEEGTAREAAVFCGFDVNFTYTMSQAPLGTGQPAFPAYVQDSYKQRLDSIFVDWGDGTQSAFEVDTSRFGEFYYRADNTGTYTYNSTDPDYPIAVGQIPNFNPNRGHIYADTGRYTITVTAVDEIGVPSRPSSFDVIVLGEEPSVVNVPDQALCSADPITLTSEIEWRVNGFDLFEDGGATLSREWRGPLPDPANDPAVVTQNYSVDELLSEGEADYDIQGGVYVTDNYDVVPFDVDAAGDQDGFVDYDFSHVIRIQNSSIKGCLPAVGPDPEGARTYEMELRVDKLPNPGTQDFEQENRICPDNSNVENLYDLVAGEAGAFEEPSYDDNDFSRWLDPDGNVLPNGDRTDIPGPPGTYTYLYETGIGTACPVATSQYVVEVQRRPYAGTNDGTSSSNPQVLCANERSFDLYSLLDGDPARPNPDPGGIWSIRRGAGKTTLNNDQISGQRFLNTAELGVEPPTASTLFQLCYTVPSEALNKDTGEPLCDSTETCVFVRVYTEPEVIGVEEFRGRQVRAGADNVLDLGLICQGDDFIFMRDLIQGNGFRTATNWVNFEFPGAGPVGNQSVFDPEVEDEPGIYRFKQVWRNPDNNGNDVCPADSIIISLTFETIPEAGGNVNVNICPDELVNLFDLLTTDAEDVGTFFGPTSPSNPTERAIPNPEAENFDFEPYEGTTVNFRYETTSVNGCGPDVAQIRVNVNPFPSEGDDAAGSLCASDGPVRLIDLIGAEFGGTWSPTTNLNGSNGDATINPSAVGAGVFTYTYTIGGSGVCPTRSSELTLTIYNEPVAGDDFSDTLTCNVDENADMYLFELANLLSPDANGAIYGVDQNFADVMEEFGSKDPAIDPLVNASTGEVNIFTLGGGNTYEFFYTTFNPGCDPDTAFLTIQVNTVGRAGLDTFAFACIDDPIFDVDPFLGPDVDDFGFWEDLENTGALSTTDYEADFDPSVFVNQFSPDTGFHYRYFVEVENCPTDSALFIAYASDKPLSGDKRQGTDSLVYACETETSVDLTEGLVDGTFTEPQADAKGSTAKWRLVANAGSSLIPPSLVTRVNETNREDFFSGQDSSSFNVEAFVEAWEGIETPAGSRSYTGGVDNLRFWQWLKTSRILNFEYTATSSKGKLILPSEGNYDGNRDAFPEDPEICENESTIIQVAVMPDYEKRFTLDVADNQPTALTLCESITDFSLNQFFTELQRVPFLDILDIYNPTYDSLYWDGIPQSLIANGAIYQQPTGTYRLNASQLDLTKPDQSFPRNPYPIRLGIISGKDVATLDKCGNAISSGTFDVDVEKIPDAGGIGATNPKVSEFTVCEGAPNVNMVDIIEGTPDEYIASQHTFEPGGANSAPFLLTPFFGASTAPPGTYTYKYNIPTEACVNPVVASYSDPARQNRPRVFSSFIDITVEAGPDLDGFDEVVNEFTVCSEPGVNLSDLFPANNDIDNSGSFTFVGDPCGTINDADDFDLAVYNWDPAEACETVLIRYTVEKEGCEPKSLDILLEISERPSPGTSNTLRLCLRDDAVSLFDVLDDDGEEPTTGGTFTIKSNNTPNGAVTNSGVFDPAIAGVGTHRVRYLVGDGVLCERDSAFATVVVERVLRTGTNGTLNACAGLGPIDLFDGLNGFFDRGGKWIAPNDPDVRTAVTGADSSIFRQDFYRNLDPINFKKELVFQYVIDNICSTDTSEVEVSLVPGPVSIDTTVNICVDKTSYILNEAFSPNQFQPGGTWRGVNGADVELSGSGNGFTKDVGTINPGGPNGLGEGTHQFIYEVEVECGESILVGSSTVTVVVGDNPSPGPGGEFAICYSDPVNLDILFESNGLGVWSSNDPDAAGGLAGNVFDRRNAAKDTASTYEFTYTVPETFSGCGPTTASYVMDVRTKPYAGDPETIYPCPSENGFIVLDSLFDNSNRQKAENASLVGGPGVTGAALSPPQFFPSELDSGSYYIDYVITDKKCGTVSTRNFIIIGGPGSVVCQDLDGDGLINRIDLDVDGDGISNRVESIFNGDTLDPFGNHDNDGLLNFQDEDFATLIGSDFDDRFVTAFNFDGDDQINAMDLDSDNDLVPDIAEAFGFTNAFDGPVRDGKTPSGGNLIDGIDQDSRNTAPRVTNGIFDYLNKDVDGDGIGDILEGRPTALHSNTTDIWFNYSRVDTDGDGTPDYKDLDSDGDGVDDAFENFQASSLEVAVNTDRPGALPEPVEFIANDNEPNFRDLDSDGDGIADGTEFDPLNQGLTEPEDFDNDGTPNFLDFDSDDDGIADHQEKGQLDLGVNTDANAVLPLVSDNRPDYLDTDSDGDGILDTDEKGDIQFGEQGINTNAAAGDYLTFDELQTNEIPDYRDLDSDGDRIPDRIEKGQGMVPLDTDQNGMADFQDIDSDGDSYLDIFEANGDSTFSANEVITDFVDFDLDGFPDYLDFDSDDDGIDDFYEVRLNTNLTEFRTPVDTDGDGIPDFHDEDSDDDSLLDENERGEGMEGVQGSDPRDSDEDGVDDYRSLDADGDGLIDRLERDGDCDGDGIPNYRDAGDNCDVAPFIPEAFTPNGDGENDFFVIPDAPFFPGNTLSVYNRWGGEVFTMKSYDNSWDGTNDGTPLPDGTYFYSFDMGIDQEPITGYVYISSN